MGRGGRLTWVILAACCATIAPARAQTPSDLAPAAGQWASSCRDQDCLLFLDIAHGDPAQPAHLQISVSVNRSNGATNFVSFRLPAYADKGKTFAIGFADSSRDATGKWGVQMAQDTMRLLDVGDCTDACVISLPGGVVPADADAGELNVAQAMAQHGLLLMFYFHDGQRITAATPLFAFKQAYAALGSGTGR